VGGFDSIGGDNEMMPNVFSGMKVNSKRLKSIAVYGWVCAAVSQCPIAVGNGDAFSWFTFCGITVFAIWVMTIQPNNEG
jgi:hypothetical protein